MDHLYIGYHRVCSNINMEVSINGYKWEYPKMVDLQ